MKRPNNVATRHELVSYLQVCFQVHDTVHEGLVQVVCSVLYRTLLRIQIQESAQIVQLLQGAKKPQIPR